jgi:hypothetical protein
MKDRVKFAVVFLLVVAALTLVATLPAQAEGSAGIVLTKNGRISAEASWSVPLTKAPAPQFCASGLLTSDWRVGISLNTPVATVTDQIAKWCNFQWGDTFQAVAENTSWGPAYLVKTDDNLTEDGELGLYVTWKLFSF